MSETAETPFSISLSDLSERFNLTAVALPSAGPDLRALPPETYPQMAEEFAAAAAALTDEGTLDPLSGAIGTWQTAASIYARPEVAEEIATDSNFAVLHSRLLKLLDVSEYDLDDPDDVRPTSYAFQHALTLLVDTCELAGPDLPRAAVTPDPLGGIRFEWSDPSASKSLTLVIPARDGGRRYIHHRQGKESGVIRQTTPENLAQWINWFQA